MEHSIYPCLWFDGNADEAAQFYLSVFRQAKIVSQNPIVVMMELNHTKFMLLNGGKQYKFTPATSFVIECDTQEDIDHYWEKLGAGGSYSMCGWLDDRFGVSWQIVPSVLNQLMSDAEKAPRVVEAFLKMKKFDIQTLLDA